MGKPIDRLDKLEPGDRLYFSDANGDVRSAGVYVGSGYVVFADASSGKVTEQYLGDKNLLKQLYAARRGAPRQFK